MPTMKTIRKTLYVLIACSITTCLATAAYTYMKKPLELDYHRYANKEVTYPLVDTDSADMTITSMKNGQFYGNIIYKARSAKSIGYANDDTRIYLRYFDPTGNPQYGEIARLHKNNEDNTVIEYKTDNDILLYRQSYARKKFPLDRYVLPFGPNVVFVKDNKKVHEETIPFGIVRINLPPNLEVTDISTKTIKGTDDKEPSQHLGAYIEIKYYTWFKALFAGILVFLVVPVMLTLVADTKMIGLDVIAFIVTMITIRTVLVDNTYNVYHVDAYFISMSLLLCLIILFKLYKSECTPIN